VYKELLHEFEYVSKTASVEDIEIYAQSILGELDKIAEEMDLKGDYIAPGALVGSGIGAALTAIPAMVLGLKKGNLSAAKAGKNALRRMPEMAGTSIKSGGKGALKGGIVGGVSGGAFAGLSGKTKSAIENKLYGQPDQEYLAYQEYLANQSGGVYNGGI